MHTLIKKVIPLGIFATINDGKDFSAVLRNDVLYFGMSFRTQCSEDPESPGYKHCMSIDSTPIQEDPESSSG